MRIRMAVAAAVVAALPLGTAAAEGFYIGGDAIFATYKESGIPSVDPILIGLRVGTQFHEFFAVEGRAAFGVADDDVIGVTLDIDHMFGVYGKGILPVADAFSLYGVVGYTRAKATATSATFTGSATESDISFGFGGEYLMSPNIAIGGEWMRFLDKSDFRLDGFMVGVRFKF